MQKGGVQVSETAYFAGGCFWCITPTFQEMECVCSVTSGYSGGDEADPTYEDVKYQRTGHRETIQVCYDAEKCTFAELMQVFLCGVDPFDEGGQFIDRGHSYTLAVYHTSQSQWEAASRQIRELEEISGREVFIALEPFLGFYPAEEEHQDYYLKHPKEFEEELIASGRKKTE
jgi:peptide-methionine (S)-S-oxide reductase